MNLDALHKKLIAAARRDRPGDRVPYAFEKRVMAHLASAPQAGELQWWGRALWYGAGACAAVALLMSAWSFAPAEQSWDGLSAALEQTVLVSVDEAASNW